MFPMKLMSCSQAVVRPSANSGPLNLYSAQPTRISVDLPLGGCEVAYARDIFVRPRAVRPRRAREFRHIRCSQHSSFRGCTHRNTGPPVSWEVMSVRIRYFRVCPQHTACQHHIYLPRCVVESIILVHPHYWASLGLYPRCPHIRLREHRVPDVTLTKENEVRANNNYGIYT
jgi:hypothetical protein